MSRFVAIGEQQESGYLNQALDHHHGRHEGRARKVALKVILVDRHVLDGNDAYSTFMLDDGVEEKRRISVGQPVENEGNVEGHGVASDSVYRVQLRASTIPLDPTNQDATGQLGRRRDLTVERFDQLLRQVE